MRKGVKNEFVCKEVRQKHVIDADMQFTIHISVVAKKLCKLDIKHNVNNN